MRPAVRSVHDLVSNIDPLDDIEREHISDSLAWIEGTNDILRRVKPGIPSPHLVSYMAVNPASILWLWRDGRLGKSSG